MQHDDGKAHEKNALYAATLDIIYSNVRIRRVTHDARTGVLVVTVTCAEREDQHISYRDVLYSQIDQSLEGERIAIVTLVKPGDFRNDAHSVPAQRFITDCGLKNLDPLEEMNRRGYGIYSHYVVKRDECIVIAKAVTVG